LKRTNLFLLYVLITLTGCNYSPPTYDLHGKLAADKSHIMTGLYSYYIDNNCFPPEEAGLEILVPEHIKNREKIIDKWGNPYQFRIEYLEDDVCEISIITLGKDQREGGEGDNRDEIYLERTTGYRPR